MALQTINVQFPGSILRHGFWLYVWRVRLSPARYVHYVGRTGDSSSPNAAPPYRRLGQHLGPSKASNALLTHLKSKRIDPESCELFEFIAHGPLFEKQLDMNAHKPVRDKVAALEKALACALKEGGYDVLNTVHCEKTLDPNLWNDVRNAFAKDFPQLLTQTKND
jgi:hypothetical protein